MSRSRNIKPGFFENERLAECQPLARLLFAGLWCEADREGRLEDRPKRIKAKCLPYDETECDDLLNELTSHGFITRYVVTGNAYIAVNEFAKHQNPHQREVPSVIPGPPDAKHNLGSAEAQPRLDPAENCTGSARLIPDSPIPHPDSPIQARADARPTKSRGSRLPADWMPDAESVERAKADRPDVSIPTELAKFRDHWKAAPGAKGVKLDWNATFRNWIRSARDGPPARAAGKPPIAQNFSAKTYTGTPDDELPAYLRSA